eukprot:s298_g24.t1
MWNGLAETFFWPSDPSVLPCPARCRLFFDCSMGKGKEQVGAFQEAGQVWLSGVKDALMLHKCIYFLAHSETIRFRTILLFNFAVEPALNFLKRLVQEDEVWATDFIATSFSVLYKVFWIYPIYCISFVLNTVMYQEIADSALRSTQRAPVPGIPVLERIIQETWRVLVNLVYLVEMYLIYRKPTPAENAYRITFVCSECAPKMGQGVSAEADPLTLKELLSRGADRSSQVQPASVSQDLSSPHHVKAWSFEARGKSLAEAPVPLCDRGGLFNAQLHRSRSYVILHIQKAEATAAVKPFGIGGLNDFAAEAGMVCSPRGLGLPEIHWNKAQVLPGLSHEIFVWHGRSTEATLRAFVQSKAWELERALRNSLAWHKDFAASLRQSVTIRGCQDMTSRDVSQQPSKELSSNSLLTADPPTNGRRREVAEPTQDRHPGGQQGPVAVPKLAIGGAPPQVPSLSSQTGSKPFVPRLALGSLPPRGQANADSASPTASRSSTDSSEGMEVDEVGSSSSRKRQRDSDEEQRSPQTARGALNLQGPSFPIAGATAPAARSARDGVPQVPQLSLGKPGLPVPAISADGQDTTNSTGASRVIPPLANGRQTILGRSDAPALNLEDIHTPEEELISSYDPENEENNYHLPDHLQRRLQLKHWRQVCSEVIPGALFISSYQVASDEEALNASNITHIVNTAADVCDNCFPDKFHYLTYYLKDSYSAQHKRHIKQTCQEDANSEDITVLLYRTMEWVHEAINKGGRVLVHCREGVSRSATIVIAYLMWRFSLSFEAAHERIRQKRPICNPNTGFTCQLLQLAKKLSSSQAGHLSFATYFTIIELSKYFSPAAPISDRASLFRVMPYHPKEPFLLLVPADLQPGQTHFDPRFGWVAQSGLQFILWMGSQVPDAEAVREAVEAHKRRVEFFERCQCQLLIVKEGEEVPQLWHVLGETVADSSLVALRSEFDSDYDLMVSISALHHSISDPEPRMIVHVQIDSASPTATVLPSSQAVFELSYIPIIGPLLYFVHSCWMASIYCFEYGWVHQRWSANARVDYFECHWLYFFGFGFPVSFVSYFCPRFIDAGVFALFFPVFVLTATRAEPKALQQCPKQLQRLPLFMVVQGVSCFLVRIFEGATGV